MTKFPQRQLLRLAAIVATLCTVSSSFLGGGITAPTFRTSHANYVWLNAVQAVGKVVELKLGQGSFIKYDVFAIK